MIAVLQGTPGSGKTTAIEHIYAQWAADDIFVIPELVLPHVAFDDTYFIQNDFTKASMAKNPAQNVFMDRDFTSTLAFVMARDGRHAQTSLQLRATIERALDTGRLIIPDIFFLFTLPANTSIQRQKKHNNSVWQNSKFIEQVDALLDEIVTEYMPNDIIHHIDGNLSKQATTSLILEKVARSHYETAPTS